MRIAQLAPPWIQVPPNSYGGIEWVVALLCDELIAKGHSVTLFASGDSLTGADLRFVHETAQTEKMGETLPDVMHVGLALQSAGEFDIIHDHSGFAAVAFSHLIETPMLHTLHGPFQPDTKEFYGYFAWDCFYNAISDYQRACMPTLNYVDTVHNAVDINGARFSADKEDFALMLGRITPDKGTHLACEVARRAGIKLMLAGKVDPGRDERYFQEEVAPLLDGPRIQYLGEVDLETKRELMARAMCFLFPIQWPEPFGLVMAEAMAAGTPVIATRNGAVPEVVVDGVTGYVVDDVEEMIAKVGDIDRIDPSACRKHVESNFSPKKMAAGYERNYEMILEQATATHDRSRFPIEGELTRASSGRRQPGVAAATSGRQSLNSGHHYRHRRHDLSDSPQAG